MKKRITPKAKRKSKVDTSPYPKGWDRNRVQGVIDHFENQSDDDAIAEAEAAYKSVESTMMQVPVELVPQVRKLIAKRAG